MHRPPAGPVAGASPCAACNRGPALRVRSRQAARTTQSSAQRSGSCSWRTWLSSVNTPGRYASFSPMSSPMRFIRYPQLQVVDGGSGESRGATGAPARAPAWVASSRAQRRKAAKSLVTMRVAHSTEWGNRAGAQECRRYGCAHHCGFHDQTGSLCSAEMQDRVVGLSAAHFSDQSLFARTSSHSSISATGNAFFSDG